MGAFAKLAEITPWEAKLQQQSDALHQVVPSSETVATQKGIANIAALRKAVEQIGYKMRVSRVRANTAELLDSLDMNGIPGRSYEIPAPGAKMAAQRDQEVQNRVGFKPGKPRVLLDITGAEVPEDALKVKRRFEKTVSECAVLYAKPKDMDTKKAGLGGSLLHSLLAPLQHAGQDAIESVRHGVETNTRLGMTPTEDPSTLPWYYPAAALTVPYSYAKGYHRADKNVLNQTHKGLDKQLEQAQQEFDQALSTEYDQRQKTASADNAGELIDKMAQDWVKSGAGEMGQLAGTYLALASLLGAGTYELGHSWAKSRDPRYAKMDAIESALKTRMRNSSIPIVTQIPGPSTSGALPNPNDVVAAAHAEE